MVECSDVQPLTFNLERGLGCGHFCTSCISLIVLLVGGGGAYIYSQFYFKFGSSPLGIKGHLKMIKVLIVNIVYFLPPHVYVWVSWMVISRINEISKQGSNSCWNFNTVIVSLFYFFYFFYKVLSGMSWWPTRGWFSEHLHKPISYNPVHKLGCSKKKKQC